MFWDQLMNTFFREKKFVDLFPKFFLYKIHRIHNMKKFKLLNRTQKFNQLASKFFQTDFNQNLSIKYATDGFFFNQHVFQQSN